MIAMTHPVAIATWAHKRLPAHSLCLAHVKHNGKRTCLAVPEAEAPAYLKARDQLAAELAAIVAEHKSRPRLPGDGKVINAHGQRRRPTPEDRQHYHGKYVVPSSKLHRHGPKCLVPVPDQPTYAASDRDWFDCTRHSSGAYVGSTAMRLHQHQTKRGRKYLMAHLVNDHRCPAVAAEKAARLAELDALDAS